MAIGGFAVVSSGGRFDDASLLVAFEVALEAQSKETGTPSELEREACVDKTWACRGRI